MPKFLRINNIRGVYHPIITFALLILISFISITNAIAEQSIPEVLILNSYHQGEDWSDNILDGIRMTLIEEYPFLVPSIEHLDTKRFPDSDQLLLMKEYLKRKYHGRQFDIVMTIDNSALNLVVKFGDELFPGVPIVFAGVNAYHPGMTNGRTNITGVAETQDMAGTLNLALTINPGIKTVLAVHDYTSSGFAVYRDMVSAADQFKDKVTVVYTPEGTVDDLVKQLKALPQDAIVMILTYVTDKNGRTLTREESTRMITSASPVPVYAMHETRLGYGILGGMLLDGREHGRQAAEITLKILSGTKADSIKVSNSRSKTIFDYSQIKRFKIPLKKIPADSIIMNRPISFYAKYREVLIPSSVLILLLGVILAVLGFSIVRIKRSKARVQVSEKKYRNLVTNLSGTPYQFALSPKGDIRFEYMAENCVNLFGLNANEILTDANKLFELIPQPDAEKVQKAIEHSSKTLMPYEVDNRIIKSDGETIWIYASSIPRKLPNGDILWDGIILNITARKHAEEALFESESRYRALFENAQDAIFVTDPESGTLLDVNRSAEELIGYSKKELIGKHQTFIHPHGEEDFYREEFLRFVNEEGAKFKEMVLQAKDGRHILAEINSGVVIELENKKLNLGIFRDITGRKQAEEALYRSHEMLKRTENITHVGSWEWDVQHDRVHWSEELFRIFGRDPSGVAPSFAEHPELYITNDMQRLREVVDCCVNQGTPYELELQAIRTDGEIRHCVGRGQAQYDKNGKVIQLVGSFQDVTDRKHAEEKLQKSEERYRRLAENSPDVVYRMSLPGGEYEYINPAAKTVFGYPPKAFYENPILIRDIIHPDWHSYFEKQWENLLKGDLAPSYEYKILHKDGSVRWVNQRNMLVNDEDNRPLAIEGIVTDITERKTAENTLRESEERYRLLYENAGLAIGYWTPGGKLKSFNKLATENMKGDPEDFIGKSAVEIFGRTNGAKYLDRITNAATKKQTQSFEDTVLLPSGEKTFLSTYNSVLAENGDIRGVQIISTEITERKEMEKELFKIKTSLEDAQRIANVGNWEWDLSTNDAWWSDELYRIYGREKSLGPPSINNFYSNIHSDDIQHLEHAINNSKKTGKYKADFRLLTYNTKEIREVHAEGKVTYDDKGEPIKHLGVVKDVTNQKKLELQLRQAQKMESIGNLAGGIAHDFNNILSSVIGFTELALDEAPKGTAIEDSLQEVYSAGKRAKDLVKQILAFARQSDEKRTPTKPSMVAKEVLKFIRSTIPTTIEIREKIESESLILGNATQVHQILMNLCTNAAQAMEESGGALDVSLKDLFLDKDNSPIGMRKGNYVEIKVSDTGVGIAPEIIGSIFEPYFTTKGPGEGTGMGLAMAQGVIENYGGKITVDSKLGEGSTFTIYLPVTKNRSDLGAYIPEQLPTGTERILFVDDEAPIGKMGSQILERLGYSVTTRTSSIDALELFRARPNDFDLIITDMTMPNMTGDILAVELMKIRQDIPVILCTGYSKKISDETASEIGIKAFAYKPIVKADLAKTIRKILVEAKGSAHD